MYIIIIYSTIVLYYILLNEKYINIELFVYKNFIRINMYNLKLLINMPHPDHYYYYYYYYYI